jgi:hypothetical protein
MTNAMQNGLWSDNRVPFEAAGQIRIDEIRGELRGGSWAWRKPRKHEEAADR